MAEGKGYGSGKSRSAANSSMRRRVAAGQTPKSKKGNAALKKVAAENPVTGFIGGGILPAKLLKAASSLRAAGQASKAAALEARAAANTAGRYFGGTGKKSQGLGLPMDRAVDVGGKARMASESLYPKLPIRGGDSPRLIRGSRDTRTFDKYADPTNEGPGRSYGRDDLNDFVYDTVKLGKFRKVGKAAEAAKKRGGR